MNRNIIKYLILGGVFIVAVVCALIFTNKGNKSEVSYTVFSDSELPTLSLESEGTKINTLYGYIGRTTANEAFEALTPIAKDHKIPFEINSGSQSVTGVSYEVRSMDGGNLVENTKLEEWSQEGVKTKGVLPIKDILEDGKEYRLVIKVTTEKAADICYYTRIVYSEDYKAKEMIDYVSTFHSATFGEADVEQYAINWEVDGSMSAEDLSHVNIHSNFSQLTYEDLKPTKIGDPIITVLEMDSTFGSFKVQQVLSATNENGTKSEFVAEEFFCVQWSQLRFYLMKYERYMTEIFVANANTVSDGKIEFGVVDNNHLDITKSPEEKYIAFTQAGDLWTYSAEEGELCKVFSFADGQGEARRAKQDYAIRVLGVDDEGNTSFLVYGYMGRGQHEGQNGMAYYVYDRDGNVLNEILYLQTEHECETIGADLDELCTVIEDQTYFLFDDTVYAINEKTKEEVRLVEGAAAHKLKISETKDTIAWAEGDSLELAKQIQIKYLSGGNSYSLTAADGEYIVPQGFIDRDFVVTHGKSDDIGPFGLETLYPQYDLSIINEEGTEVKHYEIAGTYIKSVKAKEGQVVLELLKKDGLEYVVAGEDVLMQNARQNTPEQISYDSKVLDLRGRVLYYKNEETSSNYKVLSPEQISYYESVVKSNTEDTRDLYYAYANGHLVGTFDAAGDAINSVYDDMGYVVSNSGYRIWHRKGKGTDKYYINVPEIEEVSEGEELKGDLLAMIATADGSADVESMLEANMSAKEILQAGISGKAISLNGCIQKQIFIFLERGFPILAVTADNEPVLITGYDEFNFVIYDPVKQETSYKGLNDSEEMLKESGYRMISYVK